MIGYQSIQGGDNLRVRTLASCLFILLTVGLIGTAQDPAPVYVTLWFDTEDYVLPQSDDAAKRLAETLTRLDVTGLSKSLAKKPGRSKSADART